MKRLAILLTTLIFLLVVFKQISYATYEPTSTANNKFGIHILFPDELSEAAHLVNSTGGDWGYVTIPIQDSDRDLIKWQKFMDDCRQYHLIPLIRIATEGDYFVKGSWKIPDKYYVVDFANFLNSLDWPTKNRYVIVFNEPNRGDEWGGTPDPGAYADILNNAVEVFKKRSDKFFILSAGLDNAAANSANSMDEFDYMRQMENSVPGIFEKIDGLAVHAYPNPGFSTSPQYKGANGISSYLYSEQLAKNLGGKDLPVFITETGWSADKISYNLQLYYYSEAFSGIWSDPKIVAVTPFILHSEEGSFRQFSFIIENKKTQVYENFSNIQKLKGSPQIEPKNIETVAKSVAIKSKYFTDEFTKTVKDQINKNSKIFFKWLLNF